MSGLVEELQVATSFSILSRNLSGRLDPMIPTFTDSTSVQMADEINQIIVDLNKEVADPKLRLDNETLAKRVGVLQKLEEKFEALVKQRKHKLTSKSVEPEITNLDNKVKKELEFIKLELEDYNQEGSVIEQNKGVLQQNQTSKFEEFFIKWMEHSEQKNIYKLVEQLKEANFRQAKVMESMLKEKEEKKKEEKELEQPLKTVYIFHKPFKASIDVYKQTERRYKDTPGDWDNQVAMVQNMRGSELHKLGAYLTLIQQHTKDNKLDSKTILNLLGKCFGQDFRSMTAQEQTKDAQKVDKVLTKYLLRKLGKDGFKAEEFTEDLKKNYGMEGKETVSQWHQRFTLCLKCVDMTVEEKRKAVLDFTNGISKKWKELHDTEVDRMKDCDTVDDVQIPFERMDSTPAKHEVHVKLNKNTSNYSSSFSSYSPNNKYKNKIGENFHPKNNNIPARGSKGSWVNKDKFDGKRKKLTRGEGSKVLSYEDIGMIFDIVNKKRIELLEEKIRMAQNLKKAKEELPKSKLYVELMDKKGRPYKWLVDSGSPIHIIKEELLQQYEIPYKYRKIDKYRGVGPNSFVNVTGTNKNTYMIAGIPTEIECVVAKDFPENILSWQRLTETFDDIIWKESKDERIVAFGSVQLMRGKDNVYRPLKKFDMEKLNQKIDDRKENQFAIEDNLFQLNDMASRNIMVVRKEEKALKTVRRAYCTRVKGTNILRCHKIRTYTQEVYKRGKVKVMKKEIKEHNLQVVYKRWVTKTHQTRMEVIRNKEDSVMDNLIYNVRNMQSNQNVGWTKDECKERLGEDIYQKMFDEYGEETFEKLLNTDLEDQRQEKELEDELERKKAEFGNKLEDKELTKDEMKEMYEDIFWIDKLTKKKKKQFIWDKPRRERKKESKVKLKENRKLLKETEKIIYDVLNLPEEEQEKVFQHARKIAKVKPNAMFPTWKEELEKGMFNKQELHRIWQDMKEEDKFPKEEKPWLNRFDAWSDHILRNLVCDEKIKTRIKEGIKKLLQIPPLTFEQVYTNNGGIGVDIEIDPKDYNKEPMWYMNDVKLKAAQQFVDDMLQKGFIEKIDEEEANCIVNLVVQIKDGKVRVCMDFSRMNKFVKNEYGSFFSVEEIIDKLDPNDKVGFVADLKGAFHNVLLSEESSKKCCFWFNGMAYRFKVLFFGISNGPFLFNEFLRKRLAPLKDVYKYIDDLFCTKKTVEELADSWERLVEMLVKYNIAISPEKLQFGPRLRLLGQYWQEGHLEMDFNKLIALRYVTVIRERKDLQKNLGMFMFLAKFTKGLSNKLDYFYKKTQEEPWSWTKQDAERLMRVWLEIESKTVLFPYDNKREIVLRTDAATNVGIGFSIIQYDEYGFERYIANYSKTLTPAQRNYSPIELEAYTIILALDKFYKYFVNRRFRIETDARSLTHIFNQVAEEKASKRIWRWTYILMQFDFYVVHIKGSDNVVSDWMSRHPVDIEALYRYLDEMESKQDHELMDGLIKSQEEMEKFNTIISYISIFEAQQNPEQTVESGDNYKTPTWSLLYIFHKVLKKYLDEETYLEHCREIDKLQKQQDREKRDGDTYSYILNHVVNDPCPYKESVERGSKDDGLNREIPWGRLNFVNSPYSKELLEGFIKRCMEEKCIGNTSVLLISFKYSKYIQDLLFKLPVKWDVLSILPSISFGQNNGRTYFPAMLLVEFDGSKRWNQSNKLNMSNFAMGKGTAFSLTREDDQPSSVELIYDISDDKEWIMDEMTVDEEDIDDGVDHTQFDDYNSGFNQNLETIPVQEFRMFDPQVQDGGIDAYETIVRLLLANKELTKELLNPRFDLLRKQAERFLKYHVIIEDRLCFVDPKRKNKYNKGIRYYVRVADRFKIYRLAHELNGHLSINYVMNYAQDYWWPNMYTHLKRKIEECAECARFKKDRVQDKVVNTTPFYQPFQCGHVDLIGKLPGKYHYLLVYTDHCSKYTIAIPLKTKDADTVAKALLTRVYYVVGFVELMVHDNGGEFVNDLMEAIARILGTRIRLTSVHHSSSNMVERKNKIIGQMIRCLVYDHHEKWHKFVPELVFAMNTYTPKGLLNSAFELTYGRRPWTVLDIVMDNKFKHENKDVDKWYQRLRYWVSINKALEWELRRNNYRPATKDRVKAGDIVKIAGEDTFPYAGSKKFQPYQSGPYKVIDVKDGSATLEKLVAQGEKERTLTAPTYKLTEYTMPQDNPEMPDPVVNAEDYIPIEIISESLNDDGIQTYTVRGKYFGKDDIEVWTADEFESVENKPLLDEWIRKQEEEKLLLDQEEKAKGKKRRVVNLVDVTVDEKGIATFLCEVSEKKVLKRMDLREEGMCGVKKIIIPFMNEHGYIRGSNGTWIKKQDDHIFDIRKMGQFFSTWKFGAQGIAKLAKRDAIPTSGDILNGINISIDSCSTN